MADIRSPICVVVGHVDHGKTSILDKIRGTAVVKGEAGAITQAIGASIIPLTTIKKICGDLLGSFKMKFTIPGLLFIDTPGHEAFTSLRRRGGNLADIAILVVDINEGFKPQTIEAIKILKEFKTPFIVAANKVDLIMGWRNFEGNLITVIKKQSDDVREKLDTKIYELVGSLNGYGFNSERFDRIEDYEKQIAIIPTSAVTGDGIAELLMLITGLAQRFLEQCLNCDISGAAKATVLEVKEEKGIGTCTDVILYDGSLRTNDTIVIGGIDKPIVTKVRALFEPMPLAEMREKKSRFKAVKEVKAATGVKISAPELKNVIAGMPLRSCRENEIDDIKNEMKEEIKEILVKTDKRGIVVKADTIGSLEALIKLLKEKDTEIRKADIGNISKKDVVEAESNYEADPLKAVVLGFNVNVNEDVVTKKVKIITSNIIYKVIEDFEKWTEEEKKRGRARELDLLIKPCKFQIMKGYVFRQSNPAVVGVDVLAGTLKTDTPVMKENVKEITIIKGIQSEGKNINEAISGKQVAVSMEKVMIGRQINEGDILYSAISEEDFRKFKNLKQYLKEDEIQVLKEIASIKRKENVVWGI